MIRSAAFRGRRDMLFRAQGLWYVDTNEGSVEGPFPTRPVAERYLQRHIELMNSPFMPKVPLTLVPIEHEIAMGLRSSVGVRRLVIRG